MANKYSNRSFKSLIIWILSIILLLISMLYVAEISKNTKAKEDLETATRNIYNFEIESNLRSMLLFLGLQPVEKVEWEKEELIKGLNSYFYDLNRGIVNVTNPSLEGIPEEIYQELQTLQGTIHHFLSNMQNEDSLTDHTKNEIMHFTESIYTCNVDEFNSNWEQIILELECLNKEIENSGIR